MNKYLASTGILFLSLPSLAQEPTGTLNGELETGIILTSGNTNTESYKGKLDLHTEQTHWRYHFLLEGLFKRDEIESQDANGDTQTTDTTTAEKYFGSVQADYKISKQHAALFLYAEYDRNRFSGFDYQYTLALGYTDRLFTTDNAHLTYDLGPAYTVDQAEAPGDGSPQADREDSFALRAQVEYVYAFSDQAKFTQSLSSNYSFETEQNSKTKAVTALTAKINAALALRASYTLDYNSEVPEGREHADAETALTVVFSF